MEATIRTPVKDRVGQFGSIVGTAALLLGLIGSVWQGGITDAIRILLALGAIGLALWIALTPQDALALIRGRQLRYGTLSIFLSLVLIAVVVVVYILLQRATLTLDMTQREDFTLDEETTQMLDTLDRTVQITGFYSPRALRERELDDQIFRLYEAYAGGKIQRRYIDPQEEPTQAQAYGMKYDGDVFISFMTPDGLVDFNTLMPVVRATNTERDMTVSLSRLLAAGNFKVYVEVNYSNIDATYDGQQGLTRIIEGLRQNGIEVAPLYLRDLEAAGQTIPADASTVIITRGDVDLSQAAISILDEYLKRGGALFIFADAVFTDDPVLAEDGLFNDYLWQNYGIRMLDAVVVDEITGDATPVEVRGFAVYTDIEIGSRLNQENDISTFPLFRVARAVEVNREPPVTNGQVIATSPESYGERDFTTLSQTGNTEWNPDEDVAGPFTLVAWARDENTNAKILVTGDADFITNGQVVSPLGNSILFTDGIGWLTGYSEQVSFEPQAFSTDLPLLFVSAQQLDQIAFLTVGLLPGLVLLTGVVVWLRRSRR